MNKLPLGIASALALSGATLYVTQARADAKVHGELTAIQQQNHSMAATAADNRILATQAAEVVELRQDNAALSERLANAVNAPSPIAVQASDSPSTAVYDISEVSRQPIARVRIPPKYPFEMRRAGIDGHATIAFIVDTNGNVTDAHVVKSSRAEFEAPALAAVQQWKFDPGDKDGQPCNTRMQVPIVFTLNPSSLPPPRD